MIKLNDVILNASISGSRVVACDSKRWNHAKLSIWFTMDAAEATLGCCSAQKHIGNKSKVLSRTSHFGSDREASVSLPPFIRRRALNAVSALPSLKFDKEKASRSTIAFTWPLQFQTINISYFTEEI